MLLRFCTSVLNRPQQLRVDTRQRLGIHTVAPSAARTDQLNLTRVGHDHLVPELHQ